MRKIFICCQIQLKFRLRVCLERSIDREEFELDRAKSKNNIAENIFALGHETHNTFWSTLYRNELYRRGYIWSTVTTYYSRALYPLFKQILCYLGKHSILRDKKVQVLVRCGTFCAKSDQSLDFLSPMSIDRKHFSCFLHNLKTLNILKWLILYRKIPFAPP